MVKDEKRKHTPPQEDGGGNDPKDGDVRIGVFICHCGTNIGGWIDVARVEEYVKTLPNVVHAERNLYTCADDGLTSIRDSIKEHNMNRVIVASCTPRTHAPLFRRTCQEAGLNPYLFEFVNIREQCSWVHMNEREKATEKAQILIRMGVIRAALLEPQTEEEVGVVPSAMVLGAGVAGIIAALSIANQGFEVHLVEKKDRMGGMLNELHMLYPGMIKSSDAVTKLVKRVEGNSAIKVHTSTEMTALDGYIGNYKATLDTGGVEQQVTVGTIVLATGADVYKPTGLYGYDEQDRVITQLELEALLKGDEIGDCKDIVMVQCVGSRGQDVSYCSRICCSTAIKNAILLKEANPEAKISVLHNGIRVYGVEYEALHRRAREMGIAFKKYSSDNRPEVLPGNPLSVRFFNELLGRESDYRADYVVLSTPLVQQPTADSLSKMLKVPLGQDRFFLEAHVKLRPVDFATDGIFLCGTAHAPADISESVAQAYGAASRAAIPLKNGIIRAEAITSVIDKEKCSQCTTCEWVCPFGAIRKVELDENDTEMQVIAASCKGCGACSSVCPEKAISMRNFTNEQLISQAKAALVEVI
jgi:heterodisulfide reductase subunit A